MPEIIIIMKSSHSVCINFYNTDPLGEGYLLQDFFFPGGGECAWRGELCGPEAKNELL